MYEQRGMCAIKTAGCLVTLLGLAIAAQAEDVELRVHADQPGATISKYLHGQFA